MKITNVTIAGSGVLGSQIAFQSAFHGYHIVIYDINEQVLEKAKKNLAILAENFKRDLNTSDGQIESAFRRISYSTDLKDAVKNADLMIEAIPENPAIKTEFYTKLAPLAPEKTIFATNTSTLLPSTFAAVTGRPEKFLSLHFANEIWKHNTAEIMGHATTDPEVFQNVVDFAKHIGMVALPLTKEQPGYIVNSLLVPLLDAATKLLVNGVADIETVDKAWMVATGAPVGPFGILDVVGITTAYNINKIKFDKTNDETAGKVVDFLKKNFIDQNKLGVSTNEGFYKYPNPVYRKADFLKP
ncbi:3-hydroxyacyl-CoA dehydrogenase [Kaistella jeonii]|uniref:3-hydroxybutyryl-CoA dehydrogenase n=1 Tax=Kaistella jeonii TaxID=266749 RepID=A0A0C1FKG7_9FLAO|nr:3-hydroxyacyl-CoA dehydrogenase [Kaistella jeonii]KIA88429.1 3-hydroxybutyryl-CoA dehydrogenase [Kaistella jeonii]SFC16821.1 3-hydroxybutyryl-CoA dehydrogenase [Kaistella jeonii]VEI95393.1 3-hydroxybutyryl-CoA dehydrogenase [Kaistella jeonii]